MLRLFTPLCPFNTIQYLSRGHTLCLQHVHRILDSKFSVFTFFHLVHNRSLRCGVWSSYWPILMVRTWNNTLINFFYFHIFLWKFFEFSIFLRVSCTLWRLVTARAVLKILISYKIYFLIQWFLEKRILLKSKVLVQNFWMAQSRSNLIKFLWFKYLRILTSELPYLASSLADDTWTHLESR